MAADNRRGVQGIPAPGSVKRAPSRGAGTRSRRAWMIAFGFLVLAGGTAAYVMAPSHLPTSEVTGAIAPGGSCQRPANPRILDQCVAACISCDHGTPVTCATSCRLKGAN